MKLSLVDSSSMESSICSFNVSNEVNKSVKQRCDSLPINFIHNKTSNNREYSSVTLEGLRLSTNAPTIQESNSSNKSFKTSPLYRRKILILITLAYGNFWIATCVSLQAPFFPKEAESKGNHR